MIAGGGGGIPLVQNDDGTLSGCEAVIDKDLTSALLAKEIGASTLVILTGVERVAINYNRPEQQWLDTVSLAQMKQYYQEGHFAEGSMGPKVLAAMRFGDHHLSGKGCRSTAGPYRHHHRCMIYLQAGYIALPCFHLKRGVCISRCFWGLRYFPVWKGKYVYFILFSSLKQARSTRASSCLSHSH